MTSEELHALLAKPINAIVATTRQHGGPQLSPVWFHWDGEVFTFSTTRDRVKYANIKRNPNISLIVDDVVTHRYAAAYGRAEIIEHHVVEATRPLLEKYLAGNTERMNAMAEDTSRVLVMLRPAKLVTN